MKNRDLEKAKAIGREARAKLCATGIDTGEVAALLIHEALIEMYGMDYGDDNLLKIAKRCIGYSEELMGIMVVESFRNSGQPAADVAHIEGVFQKHQDNRNARSDSGVVEQAARGVTERNGPFPPADLLKNWPGYGPKPN